MKKRILSALLCLIMLFSLCACGLEGAKGDQITMDIPQTGSEAITKEESPSVSSDSEQSTEGGDITEENVSVSTAPVSQEKPKTTEAKAEEKKPYTCTFSIECSSVFHNLKEIEAEKLDILPSGGIILARQTVVFSEGESVFDVLQRVCREKSIHMETSFTPIYNSAYVEGIHNLYEYDCGSGSGWMYCVNGFFPNYGCSQYKLRNGDVVEWRYTTNLGADIGG